MMEILRLGGREKDEKGSREAGRLAPLLSTGAQHRD